VLVGEVFRSEDFGGAFDEEAAAGGGFLRHEKLAELGYTM